MPKPPSQPQTLAGVYEAMQHSMGIVHNSAPANEALEIKQLSPMVRCVELRTPTLPPATHTNCYIVGRRDLVLIDPGSPYREVQQAFAKVVASLAEQSHIAGILLTHHHADHTGGVATLQQGGLPTFAHQATADLVRDRFTIDHVIDDNEVVRASDVALRALWTPGHAPGHLCFAVEDSEELIVGDMVASVGTILIDGDEGDMSEYLASLALLKQRGESVLYPAHGAPIRDGAKKLADYITHRNAREAKVLAALEPAKSLTMDELVEVVYSDTPPAVWLLAKRSLLAHLRRLEKQSFVTHDDGRWQRSGV